MSNSCMSRVDVDEIKRHIDRSFSEFQREMKWNAERERYRVEARRDVTICRLFVGVTQRGK